MSFLPVHAQWLLVHMQFPCFLHTDMGITLMDIVYIFFQQVRKIIYTDWSSGYLLLICLSKALMTLIQHTETTACTFTQPPHMLTQPVLSSFWLYYVMEHVLCLHMDPNNLISRWGRMVYSRNSEWGEQEKDHGGGRWRILLKMGFGLKWA